MGPIECTGPETIESTVWAETLETLECNGPETLLHQDRNYTVHSGVGPIIECTVVCARTI